MAVVAIALLAQEIAPSATWVGIAVASYTLPGAVGAVTLGRFLGGRSGAQLAGWDATLRAFALGVIPVAHAMGQLSIGLYVALLAMSSLLHSWGSAGRYTLLADVLPQKDHLAGNAIISICAELGTIVGPPLSALLMAVSGPASVLAVDAATFAVLAISYRYAAPHVKSGSTPRASASRATGFSVITKNPHLLGLITLSASFFFLFGQIYVALPTLTKHLDGSASLLAWYYTSFGIGAVVGGLCTAHLRNRPLWPTTIGIVLIVGLTLLPLGLGAPTAVSMVSFALGGVVWAPYLSTSMALYQRTSPPGQLPQVLAANSAVTLLASPLGTAVGGFFVSAWGAQDALLFNSLMLMAVALAAFAFLAFRRQVATPRDDERAEH